MQKRKLPRDANSLAGQIVAMSTGQQLPRLTEFDSAPEIASKLPLSRLDGLEV